MTVVLLVIGTVGLVAGLMVYGVIVGTWVLAPGWDREPERYLPD